MDGSYVDSFLHADRLKGYSDGEQEAGTGPGGTAPRAASNGASPARDMNKPYDSNGSLLPLLWWQDIAELIAKGWAVGACGCARESFTTKILVAAKGILAGRLAVSSSGT